MLAGIVSCPVYQYATSPLASQYLWAVFIPLFIKYMSRIFFLHSMVVILFIYPCFPCLIVLSSVQVLMNLTNDNPLGCRQIAACGGLHTIVSLIISHFPSFDCCFGKFGIQKESALSTKQPNDGCHLNNKQLNDYELDLLVALLGLLVNLVEKDSQNRSLPKFNH